jgi:hypothetical protein
MKITSSKDVEFPKLNFSICAGETKDAPSGKEAQQIVLAHEAISEVKETRARLTPTD